MGARVQPEANQPPVGTSCSQRTYGGRFQFDGLRLMPLQRFPIYSAVTCSRKSPHGYQRAASDSEDERNQAKLLDEPTDGGPD